MGTGGCVDGSGYDSRNGTTQISYTCHGGSNQKWVFAGNQIKPASNSGLCLAFDSSSSGYPRLRLQNCGTSTRQQWAFEPRTFTNPAGYGHADFIGSRVY